MPEMAIAILLPLCPTGQRDAFCPNSTILLLIESISNRFIYGGARRFIQIQIWRAQIEGARSGDSF
jgi:hypothetical protein